MAARAAFADVETWIFDLDNTLYPPSCRLFDQIDKRMTAFIAEALAVEAAEADRLRADYWRRYGTTLAGLTEEHGVAPDAFLEHVHAIDLGHVAPDPALTAAIARLPGRKIVHTNGSRGHAERVVAARGLSGVFDALYGVAEAGYAPKPRRAAYERVAALAGLDPRRAAMVEDTARNLAEPHAMGMRTLWVRTDDARAAVGADGDHVHFATDDLTRFLTALAA